MCDFQEPNTVSSLPSERGHISLISILSLTKLHCTDQSITEDNLKLKKGGKDRYFVLPCVFLLLQAYLVYLYSTVHFCLQKTRKNFVQGAGLCACEHVCTYCVFRLSDESRSSWGMMMESVCCHGDHSITQNSKDDGMSKSKAGIPRHT